jgi:hypothetical protein
LGSWLHRPPNGQIIPRVKVAVPFGLAVLIALGVLVPLLIGGVRDEIVVLGLLAPAAIGAQVGWSTRAHVPTWLFVALAVAGIALVLVGFTRYDGDGDSGPLFWVLLTLGAIALPAAALVGGIAAGSSLRRERD